MITFDESQELLKKNSEPLSIVRAKLSNSFNYYLASDIKSTIDLPPFNQSAMDGYAIRYADFKKSANTHFFLNGEVAAGSVFNSNLAKQETVRIFTGAKLPEECDTIIMQEFAEQSGSEIIFQADKIKKNAHVRFQGEQVKLGDVILKKKHKLDPASIALLASIGISEIDVFRKPNVKILITGDELQTKGKLQDGKIFESNGIMLQSLLKTLNCSSDYITIIDSLSKIKSAIEFALSTSDVILISGGVSVGDYDFTTEAIKQNGFSIVFHGVAQKPGKPILFAKRNNKYIIGLPGNPRSVYMCFYNFVYPLFHILSGAETIYPGRFKMPLATNFQKSNDNKTHFLSGVFNGKTVKIIGKQGSHIINSLACSNCLIKIESQVTSLNSGDLVDVILLI